MWKALRAIWQVVSAISTATWLWGLPWAAVTAVIGGIWAALAGMPAPIIGLVALSFGVIAYALYVLIRVHRIQSRPPIQSATDRVLEAYHKQQAEPKKPTSFLDNTLSELERAAEYRRRIAALSVIPSIETSYPRVLAEAKAVAHELEGRITYVGRILKQNDADELRKWRSKLDFQRVPFDDLATDKLAALTDVERENVRIAVRALAELDRAVDALIAKPKRFTAAHAAGLYKQRATKARVMVGKLIKVMEKEA
jgi:hypothetical protein